MMSAPLSSLNATHLADLIDALPRGNKIIFGLSLFGAPKEKNQLKQLPIQLKRVYKNGSGACGGSRVTRAS